MRRSELAVDTPILGRAELAAHVARLGLPPGAGLLVHCTMSRIGAVAHGPAALLAAIWDVIGPTATIVVPTQTANNSLTSRAHRTAVAGLDPDKLAEYVGKMKGFDVVSTPSHKMGKFAEHIRERSDSIRSRHPQTSFAAVGPAAQEWMEGHDLQSHLGERSPLGKLYAADGHVLMIGVEYHHCTAFHLAEYRLSPPAPLRPYRCFVQEDGQRVPLEFVAVDLHDGDFKQLGEAFHRAAPVSTGRVGGAAAVAFPMRAAVDFAVTWMNTHRTARRDVAT